MPGSGLHRSAVKALLSGCRLLSERRKSVWRIAVADDSRQRSFCVHKTETAMHNGIEPRARLNGLFIHIADRKFSPIDALLPWRNAQI